MFGMFKYQDGFPTRTRERERERVTWAPEWLSRCRFLRKVRFSKLLQTVAEHTVCQTV